MASQKHRASEIIFVAANLPLTARHRYGEYVIMKLADFLKEHNLTDTAFARTVGVSSEAIRRYRDGRVPTPFVMEKIIKATAKRVMPNDFFDGRESHDQSGDAA